MSSRTRSLLICHFDLSSSASIPNCRQSDVACDLSTLPFPSGRSHFAPMLPCTECIRNPLLPCTHCKVIFPWHVAMVPSLKRIMPVCILPNPPAFRRRSSASRTGTSRSVTTPWLDAAPTFILPSPVVNWTSAADLVSLP